MKLLENEIVTKMEEQVTVESGKLVSSEKVVEAARVAEEKYTMAHGSHSQHSSSQEY